MGIGLRGPTAKEQSNQVLVADEAKQKFVFSVEAPEDMLLHSTKLWRYEWSKITAIVCIEIKVAVNMSRFATRSLLFIGLGAMVI